MLIVSIKQIPLASFALAVNNVAIISSITVRNNTPNNYEGLKVRITFDPEFADTVVEDIRAILDAEAPISRRLLIKRLINNYGISRNGVRINTYLTEVFEDMGLVTSGAEDIFYWKDQEQFENYSGYRMASERESLDIAPEEVAQAILQVLKEQFAIDEDGLISETARLFGYASVHDNVNASMKRGIEHALKNNMIQLDGERYKIS